MTDSGKSGGPGVRVRHWTNVYVNKAADTVSWYQARPDTALGLIAGTGLARTAPIIDVGGGASTLVDHLLDQGYRDLTVLDIAAPALEAARNRLGGRAGEVEWVAADLLTWRPTRRFALWHDRAVFHFLTGDADCLTYRDRLVETVPHGGWAIISGFAPDGPDRCSGLPVRQVSPERLRSLLGSAFVPVETAHEVHTTPGGGQQAFVYCVFRRNGDTV